MDKFAVLVGVLAVLGVVATVAAIVFDIIEHRKRK